MDDTAHLKKDADGAFRYGCVFCTTGREDDIAADFARRYPELEARAVAQMKHRSIDGKRFHERQIMLPGYVFFRTKEDALPVFLFQTPGVLKVLREEEREWELRGDNRAFAVWVYEINGLLDVSKVFFRGQAISVAEGPLKKLQGSIVRIDKRNRNCLTSLTFNGKSFRIWLPFDYIEEAGRGPLPE